MNPSVAIDALPLLAEGGISNYVRPLVEHLLLQKRHHWGFQLFFRMGFGGQRREPLGEWLRSERRQGIEILTTRLPDRLAAFLWGAGVFSLKAASASRCDVVLAPTTLVPRSRRAKVGWFVYDLTPLRIPHFFKSSVGRFGKEMRLGARRADFILALSDCTRNDVVSLLGYPADKITVVPPGKNLSSQTSRTHAPPSTPDRPYILYLGALARNKNVDGLLRVFARCVHDYGLDLELVLTGRDFCGAAYWKKLAHGLRIERRVRFVGWVTDADRDSLLRSAAMLWQFSWYEGFGLPVLEAAGNGVPVLCTNRGAVPEILRNPDQEIDPDDEAEAAARAAEALKSPATLQAWREHGLKRAADFAWPHSVQNLTDAIEAAIE